MRDNLLLGNGVNQCTSKKMFSATYIKHRFYKDLCDYNYSEDQKDIKLYFLEFVEKAVNEIDNELNIEKIASRVYKYVKCNLTKNQEDFAGSNNDYRLQDIIKKIACEAIFIEKDKFIDIKIDKDIEKLIMKYENVYTLNYHEYWDRSNKSHYLHNRIKLIPESTEIIDSSACIFSLKFEENKGVATSLFLGDSLYPANDLRPRGMELYECLDKLDQIDIFGVSPDGDEELMEKIDRIDEKIIFIHKICENEKEVLKWKEYIGEAIYLDSDNFN